MVALTQTNPAAAKEIARLEDLMNRGEETNEGRVEGSGRERTDGEAGRLSVVHGGDDDDAGREVAQHLAELGFVEA